MGLADKLRDKHGDPDDYEPDKDSFGGNLDLPLKPGAYHVEIQPDNTAEVDTSSGGEMLKLDLKVKGPKYANRRIFENYVFDCPSNRDHEEKEQDRIMLVADACGIEGYPEVHDWSGCEFIAETGLELNEYKGEIEYQATVWDVRSLSDGPAEGPRPDDKQPDIWDEAVAFAKGEHDPRDGAAPDRPGVDKGHSASGDADAFEKDEIPF